MRITKSEGSYIYKAPYVHLYIITRVQLWCKKNGTFPTGYFWILEGFWATIFFSLVPSHSRPPAENIWWLYLNFLSLTPFSSEMWDEQSNHRTHNYVIEVQNSRLDFILRFAIFVRKRELCVSALCSLKNWATATYFEQAQAVCKFVREGCC